MAPTQGLNPDRDDADRANLLNGGKLPFEGGLDPDDSVLVDAAEYEIRSALADEWEFVGSDTVTTYLDRIVHEVAGRIEGAPAASSVVLAREDAPRTLVLPSGTVVLSVGLLSRLEDEAELAFVLARELAHVASGEAAAHLVGLGLGKVAEGGRGQGDEVWAEAARELIDNGYGPRREHEADLTALAALEALGYDTDSATRCLGRFEAQSEAGDAGVAALAGVGPTPLERLRYIEKNWCKTPVRSGSPRTNREVFRRAAGHSVLSARLTPVHPFRESREALDRDRAKARRSLAWTAAGVLVLAALLLALGFLLAD